MNPPTDHPRDPRGQFTKKAKGEALSSRPVKVRLPEDLDAVVRALPNQSEWLRRVIIEAAIREGLWEPEE